MMQGLLRVKIFSYLLLSLFIASLLYVPSAVSVVMPKSNCYVIDNASRIIDFTDWIGHPFEWDGKDSPDLVVRFCKDIETRSQEGYIDFGRFAPSNYFVPGSGNVNFIQEYYNGDLLNCEHTYGKMGRTAQVNVICGRCLNGLCKGDLGCICSIIYDAILCSVVVELAIPCEKPGLRIFQGFTVGFHPRSWEIVFNGMTQLGFERCYREFSFITEQMQIPLYMTAISSLSHLVGQPSLKVHPDQGLEVKLSGSVKTPTTLSPTLLIVEWRCEMARESLYEVTITIPVQGYEPIVFTLAKFCAYRQDKEGEAARGWATFGVISCLFMVLSTAFCCGGFCYKTRVKHQHGLDALPGMTILSACLETMSQPGGDYLQARKSHFVNQTTSSNCIVPPTRITGERQYGSM